MYNAKEKAKNLVDSFKKYVDFTNDEGCTSLTTINSNAKQCALIAVENEYNSLREMLFNLRSCKVIESENVYLDRLQGLIDEEQQVKQEIEKL